MRQCFFVAVTGSHLQCFAIVGDRKENNKKMRYGYDLNNPLEREMYFKKHERDL